MAKSNRAPVLPSEPQPTGSDRDASLPHERDQSTGDDSTGGMGTGAAGEHQHEVMGQAHEDIKKGQVDTDLRATPGLDAERRERLVKDAGKSTADPTPARKHSGR